jgi:LacI family transcriptional regulator, galactose operon repressor
MRKLTLKDIARHASVSPATVSLVLRESPLVAEATRAKVRATMESLGYVYNRGAANLRSRRSKTIGLVVCEITNPFYAELVAGIDTVMDRSGWIAFIANSSESPERQDRFIQRMREQNADGIILTAAEGTKPEIISRLRTWRLPCVQALRRVGDEPGDYVGPDYLMGVSMAVEHLIGLGHKRIAYIGGARRTSALRERLAGYRNTMRRHGLNPAPVVSCPATREQGARKIREILQAPEPPTAAVCYNDVIAFGVVLGLLEAGRQPGHDFNLVGFDNIAEAALSRPALTTIAVEPRQIGEEVAELILRRIADPDGRPERVILPPRLIIRDT